MSLVSGNLLKFTLIPLVFILAEITVASGFDTDFDRDRVFFADPTYKQNEEPTIKTNLTQRGIELVAAEIRKELLTDLVDFKLPDISGRWKVIGYKLEGIRLSVDFKNLSMKANSEVLASNLWFSDAKIHIDKITVESGPKNYLESACYDLNLRVAHQQPMLLGIGSQIWAADHKIKLNFKDVTFDIEQKHMASTGPRYCRGDIGARHILKRVLKYLLTNGDRMFSKILKSEIKKAEPAVAKVINDIFSLNKHLDLYGVPGLPDTRLRFSGAPRKVELREKGIGFFYDIHVAAVDIPGNARKEIKKPLPGNNGLLLSTQVAKTGLNIDLINQLNAALISRGSNDIEINNDLLPGVEEYLTKASIGSFLPDLLQADIEGEYVRLYMTVKDQVSVQTSKADQTVRASMPSLQIRIDVLMDGEWREYYFLNFDIALGLKTQIDESGSYKIKLLNPVNYTFEGSWAESYEPTVPWVEEDVLEVLLDAVLDALYQQDQLISVKLPSLEIGDSSVGFGNPSVDNQYLYFDLKETAEDFLSWF